MKKGIFLAVILLTVSFLLLSVAESQERLVTDEIGRKVKIPLAPGRIVSLAPNVTEILYFLGLDTEIAGVTDFCDYPEAALRKPRIGGYISPSLEKIILLKPDLIVGIKEGSRKETIQGLSDLGFSLYLIDPRGVDGLMKTIRNIGEVVGKPEESTAIVKEMTGRKDRLVSLIRSLPRPHVYFQIGGGSMVTVGKGTLADDLIHLAGGTSISGDESMSYPLYSIETILSKAPEIIIVSSVGSKKNDSTVMQKWQQFKSLPAVRRGAIHIVNSNLVDRPTPRIIDGLEALVRIIHPEVLERKR